MSQNRLNLEGDSETYMPDHRNRGFKQRPTKGMMGPGNMGRNRASSSRAPVSLGGVERQLPAKVGKRREERGREISRRMDQEDHGVSSRLGLPKA